MNETESFTRKMKSWGYYYCDLAGCEVLDIYEDSEVKGKSVYPGGGDWVVYDKRCWSGTYGYDHESAEICRVTIKKPKQHKVDYSKTKIIRKVDAITLMYRYQWIANLFMDWAHREEVSPFGMWDDVDAIGKEYDNEKSDFVNDPHLALYWLLHFGLSLDKRYVEVKQLVEKNRLGEQLGFITATIGFFNEADAFYNLEIGKDKKFENLFLKRRAYLVYITQSQSYRGGDHLDSWWKSIIIYPKAEKNIVKRMRWLKNNLLKYNRWDDFDRLDKKQCQEVSLLSYVFACNPNTKDRQKHADAFLQELLDNKSLWKVHVRKFAQVMIWDIREWVSQLELLRKTVSIYFENDTANQEYEDLMQVFGETDENIVEVREALERLHGLSEAYSKSERSLKSIKAYFGEVDAVLSEKQPGVLFKIVENTKDKVLSRRCFHYLFIHDVPDKREALISLFAKCRLSGHDIPNVFFEEFPTLIKDENDPNLDIAKSFLVIPKEYFISSSAEKKSREAAAMFFLNIAHLPSVFDFLMDLVMDADKNDVSHLKASIFTNILSEQYNSKINPTHFFSKQQIETMLQTCVDFIKANASGQYYNPSEAAFEANRSIYYCDNVLAKEWITTRRDSKEWFEQFSGITGFKSVLKDSFKSALEFIEDAPYNVYMEHKEGESHKFFEVFYSGDGFMINKGNVGTRGEGEHKQFESREQAQKEAIKLIMKYKQKGYRFCVKGFVDLPPPAGSPPPVV
jgi:predicted DNA-binding WGR domain protein